VKENMGKLVSVWSATKKTGKTLFLYSLVRQLGNMAPADTKILVCCLNFCHGDLGALLKIGDHELNLEEIVNYKLFPDKNFKIQNVLAQAGGIRFLGSKMTGAGYINRHMHMYESLFDELKGLYDLVLIDTLSGSDNALTNLAIAKSDAVINVMEQDKALLDRKSFSTGKELFYVVNRYRNIYPDEREMSSLYKLNRLFTLPGCDEMQEMKNRGRLGFYLQHDTGYNRKIREIARHMAQQLDLQLLEQTIGSKRKKGILSGLLEGVQ
jgi:MinD-like ATPase involved in chromosome partitioning or flagellar assembly